ncbi:MAG: hypothetical protein JXA14_08330 [Anaerolineae bacterium]|nr:hypothetical protein [Anaerolineae bacterium]
MNSRASQAEQSKDNSNNPRPFVAEREEPSARKRWAWFVLALWVVVVYAVYFAQFKPLVGLLLRNILAGLPEP